MFCESFCLLVFANSSLFTDFVLIVLLNYFALGFYFYILMVEPWWFHARTKKHYESILNTCLILMVVQQIKDSWWTKMQITHLQP